MNIGKLRKPVDKFAPVLGRLYRALREVAVYRQPRPTKFGFTLAGCPIMAGENWEVNEIRFFLEMLQSHDIVIDIGANVGAYTCLAASQGKHVLSIEPLRRNQAYLYRNLWENRFLDVEIFPLGLSEKSGLGRIFGSGDMASLVPGWAKVPESRFSLVPVTTLDVIAAARFQGSHLLIKIDVEGFELEVLRGAAATLDLWPRPTWLVEILLRNEAIPGGVNTRFSKTFDLFWSHGYQCRRANSARSPVGLSDVMRWSANRRMDDETANFIFTDL
ncbi:MAG: FkbM family methyltransferase [Acidobacteriaceae bacterium]